MKILYVLNSGKIGGMEVHTLDLVQGMVDGGYDVFVWCPSGVMVEKFETAGANVSIHNVKLDIDPGYITKLKKFLIQNKIDVVHAHELKAVANSLIAGYLAKTKIKISHTHTPISEWKINHLKKFLNCKFYSFIVNKFSDMEIALTETRRQIKIKEGIKEGKLIVIPNGLNTSKFSKTQTQKTSYDEEIRKRYNIPKSAFVFGCVSRLTKEKGHGVLLKAFYNFLKPEMFHKENFYLFLAGGGSLEEDLRKQAKKLEILDKIIFTGVFSDEDTIKFYSTFDAFVFPSLVEGFGIVLIEAMYSEIPTIVADLDVLKEVGDSVVFFFKSGDSADLAKQMANVYRMEVDEHPMFINDARVRVEEMFSLKKFIQNYDNLYTKLLKETDK